MTTDDLEYSDDWGPSKSQLKRDADTLQKAGEQLMSLKQWELDRLPLSDSLVHAIDESRRINSNEARRRHAQFIGRLMREADSDRILDALEELASPLRQKRLNDWVERVSACETARDTGALVQEFLQWYPHGERQHLANLCRNTVNARATSEEPTADEKARFKRERKKLSGYINALEKSTPL